MHRALHSLESALGCQLFRNEGRNLVATRAALVLSKHAQDVIDQIKALPDTYTFDAFMSLSCQSCPDVVQALTLMAVHNPRVHVTVVDGALFQDDVQERGIMAVPTVLLNGQMFANGRMQVEEILNRIDSGAAARNAATLQEKEPYDVLVVGGGPAGSAAAIYAARKGIRTGLLAERMGGAVAIGPLLQGLNKPVNDLSRGCSIDDVYKMIAITANQAIAAKAQ